MNLRVVARVREIDRRLFTIRIVRRGLRWVLLPGLAVAALLILPRFPWSAAGASAMFGSLAAIIGSLLIGFQTRALLFQRVRGPGRPARGSAGMRRWTKCLALAAVALALPSWLAAQVAPLEPGEWTGVERVRLWAPPIAPGAITGRVLEADSARLVLQQGGAAVFVPWSEMDRLDVSFGKDRNGPAFTGLFIGAAAFWLGTKLTGAGGEYEDLVALYLAAPAGALLGAVTGAVIGRREWDTVRDVHPP
jgi:hypothetical protein